MGMMQEYEHEFAEFIYYTPGSLDRESGIWPVRAGRNRAKPSYNVGPRRIECYSLHFIHEGSVQVEYEGGQAILQQGDLFCLFPDRTYHYAMLPSEANLQMSWLALDGERAESLLALAGLTPERPYRKKLITPRVKETADRLIQTLVATERWHPAAALELQGLVCSLFAELVANSDSANQTEPAGWIEECVEYMELHATEGITVQQVADFAGVHRSYFTNVFTSQIGMPPMKYLQKIRMDKAMRLLQETNATITEIALSLGYPNLYTFTRAFKIYNHVPPLAVRASRG